MRTAALLVRWAPRGNSGSSRFSTFDFSMRASPRADVLLSRLCGYT
jgi:hypothetical protein